VFVKIIEIMNEAGSTAAHLEHRGRNDQRRGARDGSWNSDKGRKGSNTQGREKGGEVGIGREGED
jgi:hypothetical protein